MTTTSDAAPTDIREQMKERPMGRFQVVAAAFCAVAIVTDAFDTVSFAVAAPFILKSLGIAPGALGLVFSAVALGMVVGAFLGSFADKVGRRTVVLLACGAAGVFMLLTGLASSIIEFVVLRFLTGCAVGAMVTTLNILALEHSNRKWGAFFLALVHVGIGVGATLGAAVGAAVVIDFGWRWIFYIGAGLNFTICLLSLKLLPESVPFLVARRPKNALARANRILQSFGHPKADSLPDVSKVSSRGRVRATDLLAPALLVTTILLAVASFAHFITAYFHNSWAPTILIDAGLNPRTALKGGIYAGLGSIAGNLLTGMLCARFDPRIVSGGAFLLGAFALIFFGYSHGDAVILVASAAVISMFGSATNTGVYLSAARSFPVEVRASGVGMVAGLGRCGAVVGPTLGGVLIGLGWGREAYYPIFAACYIAGGLAIMIAARRKLV